MSFRQFPAHSDDGETYVVIEFRDNASNPARTGEESPRYELADGRRLIRQGQTFSTAGGELKLSLV